MEIDDDETSLPAPEATASEGGLEADNVEETPPRAPEPSARVTRGGTRGRGRSSAAGLSKKASPKKKRGRGRGTRGTGNSAATPAAAAVPRRRRQLVLPSMDEEEDNVNPSVADDTVRLQEEENTAPSDDAGASHPKGGENVGAVNTDEPVSSPLGKRKSPPPPDADQGTAVLAGSAAIPSASTTIAPARPSSRKKLKIFYARSTIPSAAATPTEATKDLDATSSGTPAQPLGLSGSSPSDESFAWMPEVTSWCTTTCSYLSNLSEKLQMGFKDGRAALSEVSSLRASLKKSEEQIALLAAHHDKIGALEVDNANLQKINVSQKKEIEDLRKAKGELEKGQEDLRKKMEEMKSAFEQQICDGGAAVLAVAKSHYRAIDASVVSGGFNCSSSEEVEALIAEVKPACSSLLQNMGLTSLSDDED